MTLLPPYDIGTVTLTNGSADIVGNDTAWAVNGVTGGLMTVEAAGGNPLLLADVADDTTATAATKWMGPSGTFKYAISLESAQAADVVWANRHWSRVVGQALLAALRPDASGTLAERDALNPQLANGQWFARAEPPHDLEFYRKVPEGWEGPYLFRGAGGVGQGGLGLPSPGAAGMLPWYSAPDTISLTALTAFARTLLDDADAATMRATLDAQQNLGKIPGIELGQNLSGDRVIIIDFHASDAVDYSFRIGRHAGANGPVDIFNTGSGAINITAAGGVLANGSQIVTDARMSGSLSGYQQFPNGLILQWGRVETATNANGNAPVVYPVAFPNAPLLFIPINGHQETVADPAVSVGTSQGLMVSSSLAYASFRPNPGDAVPVVVNWIALGY